MALTSLVTPPEELHGIAKARGRVYDPGRQQVWCSECGAPVGRFGVIHAPDCSGDESEIRFRDPD